MLYDYKHRRPTMKHHKRLIIVIIGATILGATYFGIHHKTQSKQQQLPLPRKLSNRYSPLDHKKLKSKSKHQNQQNTEFDFYSVLPRKPVVFQKNNKMHKFPTQSL